MSPLYLLAVHYEPMAVKAFNGVNERHGFVSTYVDSLTTPPTHFEGQRDKVPSSPTRRFEKPSGLFSEVRGYASYILHCGALR